MQEPWGRVVMDGKEHKHAFYKNTTEKRTAEVNMTSQALVCTCACCIAHIQMEKND
jgi:hypothetical protein